MVIPPMPAAMAAEWEAGLSAARPYPNVPEADLSASMGYVMTYPDQNIPAERYCDVLEMYLPREDVVAGEGTLTVYDEKGKVMEVSFADEGVVEIRPLEEQELESLMWGGGVCVEIHLPQSLRFDDAYYVLMDEGCYTAADGAVSNPAITSEEAWRPAVSGEYGVSGFKYVNADGQTTGSPAAGNAIEMELVLGGDAASAVIYCEDDSVYFDPIEYTESGAISGEVTADSANWGVVFLNADGEVLDVLAMGW